MIEELPFSQLEQNNYGYDVGSTGRATAHTYCQNIHAGCTGSIPGHVISCNGDFVPSP